MASLSTSWYSPPASLPETPESPTHVVHLYGSDENGLARKAGRYLWEGLKSVEALLVIATREHAEAMFRELDVFGVDHRKAVQDGLISVLEAKDVLTSFMIDGEPDWPCFEKTISEAIDQLQRTSGRKGIRAYGEMVGILWSKGQISAAVRLEEYWNNLLEIKGVKLFCSYPIDLFGEEIHARAVDDLLCAHTHLVPIGEPGDLERALDRTMEEVLALNINGVARNRVHSHPHISWPTMPRGEADLLSVRRTYSEFTGEILARARKHYQNEKRLRALLENSFDAISLADEYGNIIYASASSVRVLGYQPQELIGRSEFELVHPDDLTHVNAIFAKVLSTPHFPIQLEFRARHKDGCWLWIERTSTNLLEEPELNAIVSNYRDISERKVAEDEKQRHSEELIRTNEELQAFTYAAAHDLKEPLRTISACTQLLSRNTQLDNNGRKLATFVVESAKRMSILLDDLLSFAGLNSDVNFEEVELAEALRQAIKNLKETINESSAKVTFGSLPSIRGNRSHVIELFQNLIANAIKYRSEAPVEVHITASRSGHQWVVKIKDNGIGIAPEYHNFIFGLLKRLHGREVPGTGIGLAICKKIVEAMGGRIWVESALQKGSTFCFTATE